MTSISLAQKASQQMRTIDSSEKELLNAALRFDPKALATIYDLYSPELYRYAARFLGDPSVAEDCVADTFSRFLKAIHAKRGPKDYLKAYLYRIAHNWIADYYRRTPDVSELKDTFPDSDNAPEQEVSLRLRQVQVRNAIQHLTPDQQQVIALKYLEGWKNKEIAQALKKPVGAVKSLQHRALTRLKKYLESKESLS
jgi:RNA polymerase sigma-70 factor (ECF subfamily)